MAETIDAAMALFNMAELFAALPAQARLLGLDPGARRIGLALSDVGRRIASPYGVLPRSKLALNAAQIVEIAAREGVAGLVIGLPLNEAQSIGPAAQAARDWGHAVSAATGLPALMFDESLSTASTLERLIEAGVSRARRKTLVDKLAAATILQAALDEAWARHKKGGAEAPPRL